jgi:hypothetical protein
MLMLRVFIVVSNNEQNDAVLRSNIATQFPTDFYELGRGQWLVAFSGTAQELSVKLGVITSQGASMITGVAVFGIAGYYGVASRDMWEWIATKLSNSPGAGGQIG